MPTKTLLDLTSNILSAMDSDEVNSINDTVESYQVATIILETLEAEFNNIEIPSLDRVLKLQSVSDLNRPNYLRYGDDVGNIDWLRYRDAHNGNRYKLVTYVPPTQFFDRAALLTATSGYASMKEVTDPSGVTYWIRSNSAPTFYTSVDNDYLIFDSYDADAEDTLENVNSFALGKIELFNNSMTDDYVPPIPASMFPLLLAEAKATCFLTLKQMPSPKSEQIARRQRSRIQNNIYKSRKAGYPYASSKFDFSRNR